MNTFTKLARELAVTLLNIDNYVVRCIAIHATLRSSKWSAL